MKICKNQLSAFFLLISIFVIGRFAGTMTVDGAITASKLTLDSKNEKTYVGGTVKLKASAVSSKITWKSSKPKIASVTSKGKVKGKKAGVVTITASLKANSKVTAKCRVKVYKATKTLKLTSNSSYVLEPGEQQKLNVKVINPSKGAQPIVWRTKDKKIASVDQSGSVTAISLGRTTITGTSGNKSIKVKITVKAADNTESDQNPEEMEKPENDSQKPETTEKPGNESQKPETTEKPGSESQKPEIESPDPDYMPQIQYRAHVEYLEWQDWKNSGETAGTTEQALRLEAVQIKLNTLDGKNIIQYRAHVENEGWQDWKSSGEIAGTMNQGLRLEAIQIKLIPTYEKFYDIYYRIHVKNLGWLGWAKNGYTAGSTDIGLRAEAIQIKLVKKGISINTGGLADLSYPDFYYQSHVENEGWQTPVKDSEIAGTIDRALRLEALIINLKDFDGSHGISYRAHVADNGWQDWKLDGEIAGTIEQCKAIEAIEIKLAGRIEGVLDIYYRMHVEHYGWLGWAKNGETAGTTGGGIRAEAVQIKLIPKDAEFPVGDIAYMDLTNVKIPEPTPPGTLLPQKDRIVSNAVNRITCGFGAYSGHKGTDIGWSNDENLNIVYPHSDGIVVAVQSNWNPGMGKEGMASYGNYVVVQHSDHCWTRYAHLNSVDVVIEQKVDRNSRLGIIGSTGNVTGRHLHVELITNLRNNTRIDIEPYLMTELP